MTGIYKITCLANNKCYIGQSVAIKRRWNDHQKALAGGTHYNTYLQNAYNKYGKGSFVYEILE
jgi:group I intron endonuclease